MEHRHDKFDRRGFTVIELLVSTAVISVMVSLLLPAVQNAREAARQAQCKNNLRQLGLALHNFEGTHQVFPASGRTVSGPGNPFGKYIGWRASILPYLEQASLFDAYDFDEHWWHPKNVNAGAAVLSVYQCPSVPQQSGISFAIAKEPRPDIEFPRPVARSDYEAMMGVREIIDSERYRTRAMTRSVMFRNSQVRFGDITDGTSNTIAVTECAARPSVYRNRTQQAGLINDQGFGWIDSESAFSLDGASNDGSSQGKGPEINGVAINATNENEPYAFHHGGAMFLFADGHASFLSESIDLKTLAAMVTKSGGEINNDGDLR